MMKKVMQIELFFIMFIIHTTVPAAIKFLLIIAQYRLSHYSIHGHRNFYNDLRNKLSMDPRAVIGDDPLSQNDEVKQIKSVAIKKTTYYLYFKRPYMGFIYIEES